MKNELTAVKKFWEENPLFSGESAFEPGSKEFFEEHRSVYFSDVFANDFKEEFFIPPSIENAKALDLGCGTGFWTIEIQLRRKCKEFHSADLTRRALELTKKRLTIYNQRAQLSLQNAENMSYADEYFDHVNCQGVIHHTPDTAAAVREIARVLRKGGTACISVYYRNIILRNWPKFAWLGRILFKMGAGLKGRGRESIFTEKDPDKITRLYDGTDNPIGKSYSKEKFSQLFTPYFDIIHIHQF